MNAGTNCLLVEQLPEVDERLIELLRAGDSSAFRTIYDLYKDRVYSLARRVVGDPAEAGEVTQQIFVKVFMAARGFQGRSAFSTWLFRVAVNMCHDHLRSRHRRRSVPLEEAESLAGGSSGDAAADSIREAQLKKAVRKAARTLSPEIRSLLVLKYVQELTYAEIAAVVGCREGTVSSRLNRAHKLLAAKLEHLKVEL